MAKKHIPNASNENTSLKDDMGNIPGLDDWESTLGDLTFVDFPDENSRKPVSKIRQGISAALKSTSKHLGPSILSKTRSKFIDIDNAINSTQSILSEADYSRQEFIRDLQPSINLLKQTGRVIDSQIGSSLPPKLANKIKEWTKEASSYKTPTQKELRKAATEQSVNQVFESAIEEQIKLQASQIKSQEKNKLIDRTFEKFRHEQMSELVNDIRVNTEYTKLFTKNTYTAYLKKSLELKYEHLFVAKDTLGSVQALAKITEAKLDQIRVNTGLPDIQKQHLSESWKETYRKAYLSTIYTQMGNLGKNFLKNIKSNLSSVSDTASMVTQSADSLASLGSMMGDFGVSTSEITGDLAGQALASVLGGKISNKLFGKNGKFGPLTVYGNNINNYVRNLKSRGYLKLVESQRDFMGSPLGWLLGNLDLDIDHSAGRVVNNLKDPNSPTQYDTAARTSLVEIIPGYLAKILQQTTNIAQGTTNSPELVFDISSRNFVTAKQFRNRVINESFGTAEQRGSTLGNIVGTLRGAYVYNRGNEAAFDKMSPDISKVFTNAASESLDIKPEIFKKYRDGETLSDAEKDYINTILANVNSDPKSVAKVITDALYKNDDTINTQARDTVRDVYYKYFETSDNYKQILPKYLVGTGQARYLEGLVNSNLNASSYDRTKINTIQSIYDENSFGARVNWNSTHTQQFLSDDVATKMNNPYWVRALFNTITGNATGTKDQDIEKLVSKFTRFKDNPTLLKQILLQYIQVAKTKGIDAADAVLEKLSHVKDFRPSKIPGALKNAGYKLFDWTTTSKDYYTVSQKEILSNKYNPNVYNNTDVDFLFDDDIQQAANPTVNVKHTNPADTGVSSGLNSPIVKAIQHFESVFISYMRPGSRTTSSYPIIDISSKPDKFSPFVFSTAPQTKDSDISKPSKLNPFKTLANLKSKLRNSSWVKKITSPEWGVKVYNSVINGIKNYNDTDISWAADALQEYKNNPESLKKKIKEIQADVQKESEKEKIESSVSTIKDVHETKQIWDNAGTGEISNTKQYDNVKEAVTPTAEKSEQSGKDAFSISKEKIAAARQGAKNTLSKKPQFIDIYRKQDLDSKTPIITAVDQESGAVCFYDGKPINSSFDIDRQVIEKSTGYYRLTRRDIRKGIFNAAGKDITKRSAAYRAEQLAAIATEKTILGAVKLTGQGIKLGFKAALFGMGLYGRLYWYLAKFGFMAAKGILKGLVKGGAKGLWYSTKGIGKGILGLGKGLGKGALSLSESLSARMDNTQRAYEEEIKELWGPKQSSQQQSPQQQPQQKQEEDTSDTKSPSVTPSDTKNTDTGTDTEEKQGLFSRVKGLFGKKKTPEQITAESVVKLVKLTEKENKRKKKVDNAMLDEQKNTSAGNLLPAVMAGQIGRNVISKVPMGAKLLRWGRMIPALGGRLLATVGAAVGSKGAALALGGAALVAGAYVTSKRSKAVLEDMNTPVTEEQLEILKKHGIDTRNVKTAYDYKKMHKQLESSWYKPMSFSGIKDYFFGDDPAKNPASLISVRAKAYGIPIDQNRPGLFASSWTKLMEKLEEKTLKIIESTNKRSGFDDGDLEDLADDFGFDDNDPEQVKYFTTWYRQRFVPCFKTYIDILKMANSTYLNADQLIDEEKKKVIAAFKQMTDSKVQKLSGLVPTKEAFERWLKNKEQIKKTGMPEGALAADEAARQVSAKYTSGAKKYGTSAADIAAAQLTGTQGVSAQESLASYENSLNSQQRTMLEMYKAGSADAALLTMFGVDVNKYNQLANPGTTTQGTNSSVDLSQVKPAANVSTDGGLGSLSAQFESGKAGSAAIGYDSTGGTSYGKYQIASNSGTFAEFIKFAKEKGYTDIANALSSGPANTGGRTGVVPNIWRELAKSGKLGSLEHDFIKKSHYDVSFSGIKNPELKAMIESSPVLQDVLWSTSVQHGPDGGASVFNSAYKPGMSPDEFIRAVYSVRGTKFGSSTPQVRASVQNRFKTELSIALGRLQQESTDKPTTELASTEKNTSATVVADNSTVSSSSGEGSGESSLSDIAKPISMTEYSKLSPEQKASADLSGMDPKERSAIEHARGQSAQMQDDAASKTSNEVIASKQTESNSTTNTSVPSAVPSAPSEPIVTVDASLDLPPKQNIDEQQAAKEKIPSSQQYTQPATPEHPSNKASGADLGTIVQLLSSINQVLSASNPNQLLSEIKDSLNTGFKTIGSSSSSSSGPIHTSTPSSSTSSRPIQVSTPSVNVMKSKYGSATM